MESIDQRDSNGENGKKHLRTTGPNKNPSRVAWIAVSVVIACALVGIGGLLKWWNSMEIQKGESNSSIPVYQGASAHWDSHAVPISMKCAGCHPEEFRQWSNSDHAWAFRPLDAKLEAEAFHGNRLNAHGSTLTFSTGKQGERLVHDQKSGRTWPAVWATGRTPLVQYLLPSSDGGFHTLSAAWDVQRKEWFDIFGSDSRQEGDWGHWLGRGMNWNSQCAWCHMTSFQKNYDSTKDRYASTWKEPGVTCIQCHGPVLDKPEPGTGCMIATSHSPSVPVVLSAQQHRENCASCHARRDEFDHNFSIGKRFDDHFQLVLPVQPGVFWPNGMQRDEDYCETGLRLSRMGKAGVTCLDCHDPHSGLLKLPQENNALCMRCHASGEKVNGIAAPVIDMKSHTPCPISSMGGRCVECHMPTSLYMARDPRRDHSFNSPDPFLSQELNIPNACIMCHKDKDNNWAKSAVDKVYGDQSILKRDRPRTRAVQAAYSGQENALELLLAAYDREENETWKATIMELLDTWCGDVRVIRRAQQGLKASTPLLRSASTKIIGRVTPDQVQSLLKDPSRCVRLQAAWALRDSLSLDDPAFRELIHSAAHQSDQPSGAMKLAQIEACRHNDKEAQYWFEKAMKWDATSPVVCRDYAVYLASRGKHGEAVDMMEKAVKIAPKDASLWYLLGLGQVEAQQPQLALRSFNQAIQIDPSFVRARYNKALLANQLNDPKTALAELNACSQIEPNNAEIIYASAVIYFQTGDMKRAHESANRVLKLDPSHQGARTIYNQTSRQ